MGPAVPQRKRCRIIGTWRTGSSPAASLRRGTCGRDPAASRTVANAVFKQYVRMQHRAAAALDGWMSSSDSYCIWCRRYRHWWPGRDAPHCDTRSRVHTGVQCERRWSRLQSNIEGGPFCGEPQPLKLRRPPPMGRGMAHISRVGPQRRRRTRPSMSMQDSLPTGENDGQLARPLQVAGKASAHCRFFSGRGTQYGVLCAPRHGGPGGWQWMRS